MCQLVEAPSHQIWSPNIGSMTIRSRSCVTLNTCLHSHHIHTGHSGKSDGCMVGSSVCLKISTICDTIDIKESNVQKERGKKGLVRKI